MSLFRNNQNDAFNKFNLTNLNSFTSNTQAIYDNQVITKAYVDQFSQENEQSRTDLDLDLNFHTELNDMVKNNPVNFFNNNELPKLDSITVN